MKGWTVIDRVTGKFVRDAWSGYLMKFPKIWQSRRWADKLVAEIETSKRKLAALNMTSKFSEMELEVVELSITIVE